MKIYYVANARLPNEKAHGIQIAKMAEAFLEEGLDVTLIAPKRQKRQKTLKEFYGLRVEIPIRFLPVVNWYNGGPIGYRVSSYSFMLASLFYLWGRRFAGEIFLVYTVDLDNFSSSLLPLAGVPLYSEMHGGKPRTLWQYFLFAHLAGVIAINSIIVREFNKKFKHAHARYLVQSNGVDAEHFSSMEQSIARTHLTLPPKEKIVLYAGRFFGWKGLETIPDAARLSPEICWYMVGGTKDYFTHVTGISDLPPNMVFMGSQPHTLMQYWISAADTLIVLGTIRDPQSYWYTSPMKLFEYLLSERPIVASATPAIKEIVSEDEVRLYKPDSAEDLAKQVRASVEYPEENKERILKARTKGQGYSWKARAEAIAHFIESH